ncbi:MAG: bifunctional 3-deoxy-7-phosphoheptulonate synthase/chorismate mutase, partial [Cyanobacteria bacterium SZAS LIN-2]|nr:bifunctional 3-deoxy-7-phosphoheptulonate synthase/chorismate mutase [Cyanobacteria bacterium SZAS LIN-2]
MKEAKLSLKQNAEHKSIVAINDRVKVGDKELLIVGGPCSVESPEQIEQVASHLSKHPIQGLRGGVHKPRTSPYAFQGMGKAGLDILQAAREKHGMPVVTEVMSVEQLADCAAQADVLQVGSRNMQNFELLKALGTVSNPILLKRGLCATIEEFIMAAEYIMANGNPNVILCERGIRSYDDKYTRNVLDLGAVIVLKQMTHLPVIVDPSHAAGKRELVADLARAAIACGADGLIIECHPVPEESVSDARQALSLDDMCELVASLEGIARAVGRTLPAPVAIEMAPEKQPQLISFDAHAQLAEARVKIDEIDQAICALLEKRWQIGTEIAEIKAIADMPVKDNTREQTVLNNVRESANDVEVGLALESVFKQVIVESCKLQKRLLAESLKLPQPQISQQTLHTLSRIRILRP